MNCYEILGIPRTASLDDIIRAHRNLVKKYHPDRLRNPTLEQVKQAQEKFTQVQEAYETLTRRRAEYDEKLRAEEAARAQAAAGANAQAPDSAHVSAQAPSPFPDAVAGRKLGSWALLLRIAFSSTGMLLFSIVAFYTFAGFGIGSVPESAPWYVSVTVPGFSRSGYTRAEQFEGTIRNPTTNASAELKISMIESDGGVGGCMSVGQPFSGSGTVKGGYYGADFDFIIKTKSGKYRFRGKRRDGDIGGTYVFEPAHQPAEAGTFTLGKVEDVDRDEGLSFYSCQTDAELHQR